MRLPDSAQTSRPWRIHELTRNFRIEDVWALPTPGGPDTPKTRGAPGVVSSSARCNVPSSTARPRKGVSDAPRKCSLFTAGFRPSNRKTSTGSGIPFNVRGPSDSVSQ